MPSTSALALSRFNPKLKVLENNYQRKTSLYTYSSDISEDPSDVPEVDVVAKKIPEEHSLHSNTDSLDAKSQELQFQLLAACAGVDRCLSSHP
jgi:hypothetical protein